MIVINIVCMFTSNVTESALLFILTGWLNRVFLILYFFIFMLTGLALVTNIIYIDRNLCAMYKDHVLIKYHA